MSIRAKRRTERKNEVLDSALKLVESGGAPTVTMAAIAADMNASIGGLYRYYPTKVAIFVGLQLRAIEAFNSLLTRRLDTFSESDSRFDVLNQVVEGFGAWSAFRVEEPVYFRLLDQFISVPTRSLDDAGRAIINQSLLPVLTRLATTLSQASQVGVIGPGDAMARTHILWAGLHGLEQFRKRDEGQEQGLTVDALIPLMLRDMLMGWGASKGLVESVLPA